MSRVDCAWLARLIDGRHGQQFTDSVGLRDMSFKRSEIHVSMYQQDDCDAIFVVTRQAKNAPGGAVNARANPVPPL